MSRSLLIAYATRYGSTKEVAEFIGKRLSEKDLEIKVLPCKEVKNLDQYDYVILGTPYYIGKMLKDARTFISSNQEVLMKKTFAFFALGPIGDDQKEKTEAKEQMKDELKQFCWLQPVSAKMFGGKYDPDTLRFFDNLLTKPSSSPLHDLPANDSRDWDLIAEWIKNLPIQ